MRLTTVFILVLALIPVVGCDESDATDPPAQPPPESAADTPDPDNESASDDEATADRPPAPTVGGVPRSFADIVERARPAVVNIYTRKRVVTGHRYNPFSRRGFVPEERIEESLGSGFIIDEAGHVLTNFHVVENATEIGVRLLDERFFKADVVGTDPKTDLALLKVDNDDADLPVLPLGDSQDLRVGDWVIAIGNPLGLASTVTAGIASAVGRKNIPISRDMRYKDFIQTDASINPGNSGGPLIDVDGRVVGINTAISAQGQGIGFAVPINMARVILDQLKEHGRVERSWLGVYAREVPEALRAQLGLDVEGGVLVRKVVGGGPADKAGLKSGDIIYSLDATVVEDPAQMSWIASNLGVGKKVEVVYYRADEERSTTLTMGALPD
ncbi:MAG: S1C family serine protease [Myxococcota bacterium]